MQIDVQTQDGVVRLSGFVDSMAQVDRAGELARRVDGVSGVRNSIRVTARPRAHERRAWLIALTRRSDCGTRSLSARNPTAAPAAKKANGRLSLVQRSPR